MEKLYDKVLGAVENGAKYRIDLVSHSLWLNCSPIIINGEVKGDYEIGNQYVDIDLTIPHIESLYAEYKHSRPGKRNTQRAWFKAIKADDLEDGDYDFGVERYVAQFKLEYTVLAAIMLGVINESIFERPTDWFWSSPKDRDLIISRNWLNKNN